MTSDDMELVRLYIADQSESAFTALVARHTNLVYSAALRRTGNAQLAEESTQAVFIILASKAGSLDEKTILPSWLYRTACYVSGHAFKQELRRQQREQEAYMQSLSNQTESEVWPQIKPLLEEAMLWLGQTDRDALVLRFFEGRNLKEVGAILGTSEAATKMRVNRAVEKLRGFFTKRGIIFPAVVLTAAISTNSVQAAPVALAKTATAVALAKGAAASTSTLTLTKGALKLMAWSKAKIAIVVGMCVLLAAGTSIVGFKKYEASHSDLDSWRIPQFAPDTVAKAAPQVRILPTKFTAPIYGEFWAAPDKWAGVNVTIADLARTAYNWSPGRIYFPDGEPSERYDFATTLSRGNREALQKEVKKNLGFIGGRATINSNVFVLKVQNSGMSGLKPHTQGPSSGFYDIRGHIISKGFPLSVQPPDQSFGLARYLEAIVHIPVIDETGLKGNYDVDFRWDATDDTNHVALKQAMLDQLGLEMVSTNMPVQMLVMQKVN